MSPPETPAEFLSADELIGAWGALLPDDRLKLAAIEAVRRRGTGFQPNDLIHEAFCRALLGERNCPRDVPFMAFMAQTMRSIASHERERLDRLRSLDENESSHETAGRRSAGPYPSGQTPEDAVMDKEQAGVKAIYACVADDAEAQLVLMAWEDELRGAPLREATGLDQGQLDYAIKRIRASVRKAYPRGWIV